MEVADGEMTNDLPERIEAKPEPKRGRGEGMGLLTDKIQVHMPAESQKGSGIRGLRRKVDQKDHLRTW